MLSNSEYKTFASIIDKYIASKYLMRRHAQADKARQVLKLIRKYNKPPQKEKKTIDMLGQIAYEHASTTDEYKQSAFSGFFSRVCDGLTEYARRAYGVSFVRIEKTVYFYTKGGDCSRDRELKQDCHFRRQQAVLGDEDASNRADQDDLAVAETNSNLQVVLSGCRKWNADRIEAYEVNYRREWSVPRVKIKKEMEAFLSSNKSRAPLRIHFSTRQ